MSHDLANEEDAPHEVELGDQAVFVAADVEDDKGRHEVRCIEGLFHVGEAGPVRTLGDSIPMIQRGARLRVVLAENSNGFVAHDVHRLDGPIMGPRSSTLRNWVRAAVEIGMKVVWSPRAIRHLTAVRKYIEKDSEQNAVLVARRILQAVELLEAHPELGRPGRMVGTRELVVADTPYIIPYRVRNERLELMAVFHGRQRWPEKL